MKEIKVFIASANDEIEERQSLKNILTIINEVSYKFGITISPEMWELKSVEFKSGLQPKQNEYTEALTSCDIVFFVFGKRVGHYTRIEFENACEQVRNKKHIKVFAYFKKSDLGTLDNLRESDISGFQDIIELKKHISQSLEQVYGEFKTISELQSLFVKEILSTVFPLLVSNFQFDDDIQRIIELYGETNKLFQIDKRNSIIKDAIFSLFFLSKYNYTPKLDQDSFYKLCHQIISSAREGAINALSMMLKYEWNDSPEEKEFWKDNQDAVKRNVYLERIFVVSKNSAHRLKTIPQIINHITLEETYDCIHSYVVEKEVLQRRFPDLLERAGNGFIFINSQQDKIALLDETAESGQRAKPVINSKELDEILETFNEIKKLSVPLKSYLNNIAWAHYKKEMISIFVTTKCNLNCDYCFTNKNQTGHRDQTISLDFVKKGLDDYFKTDYMRHVRFFGAGEPTVEFDLLKRICAYAKIKGGQAVTFEIQTNGAFSDSIAIWLKKNINIIWISCDGTPDIQDRHRPFLRDERKTSAVIEKNIRILQGTDSKAFVGIRSTITSENITRQKEMIDYFYELGIRTIWVDPLFPSVGKEPLSNDNDFDTMLFAQEFLDAIKYAHERGVFYGSILTCNFNDSVNKHCRACLPVPHLTTDGYISACDMALFGNDNNHMSKLIYGRWDESTGDIIYEPQKIEYLQSRTTENLEHCEMCSAKEHCGGYCLGEVLNETGDLFGCKKGVCDAIRYLDRNMDADMRKYKYTHP